jgi:2-oxoglutarate dehydrogenase E2 component (dihydrolipoamide succinyltransferase)
MQIEVVMPKMGESIQEGTILQWMKKQGEQIEKEETLLEISTDKVDSDIPAPVSGILKKIIFHEQETVPVGTVIAYIETDLSGSGSIPDVQNGKIPSDNSEGLRGGLTDVQIHSPLEMKSIKDSKRFYSPLVKMIAKKEGLGQLELERIEGSGLSGRVMKKDILEYIERSHRGTNMVQAGGTPGKISSVNISEMAAKYPSPKYQTVKMDALQKKMAEHMVQSVATAPHVTIIEEVEMTEIVNFRLSILQEFEKQHGFKLTYTPFFADALVRTVKQFPLLNCSVEGDVIIYKNFINLGIAVASPGGLIVPVVHAADEKSFIELAQELTNIVVRARQKKLTPADVSDGTISMTNFGVFGSILGTPIINQPQTAILGIGSIKKRPVVVEDETGKETIGIRSMIYLTLTFDHRVVDGAMGGKFLSSVKGHLENFNFELVQ